MTEERPGSHPVLSHPDLGAAERAWFGEVDRVCRDVGLVPVHFGWNSDDRSTVWRVEWQPPVARSADAFVRAVLGGAVSVWLLPHHGARRRVEVACGSPAEAAAVVCVVSGMPVPDGMWSVLACHPDRLVRTPVVARSDAPEECRAAALLVG